MHRVDKPISEKSKGEIEKELEDKGGNRVETWYSSLFKQYWGYLS